MTREEIAKRAASLTMAVVLKLNASGEDMIEAATEKMVDFYRSTLEEAARAVCDFCNSDVELCRNRHGVYTHIFGNSEDALCAADEIHDLAAALDKEVGRG